MSRAASVDFPAPGGPAMPTMRRLPGSWRWRMASTTFENTNTPDIGLGYPRIADFTHKRILREKHQIGQAPGLDYPSVVAAVGVGRSPRVGGERGHQVEALRGQQNPLFVIGAI